MITIVSAPLLFGAFWCTLQLRRHRTNAATRLACSCFRQIAHLSLDNRQVACGKSVQPDEKTYFAIRTPELCGVALKEASICRFKN